MKPKVVEIFSGAGFFSYAFAKEGFEIIHAVEIDTVAAETYYGNIGKHIEVNDVLRAEPKNKSCEVLLAGSPSAATNRQCNGCNYCVHFSLVIA